jgi:hypothetical protein
MSIWSAKFDLEDQRDTLFIFNRMESSMKGKFIARQFSFMRTPLGFLKCANEPLLPLTVWKSSARIRLGKIFSYCRGETKSSNARDHYPNYSR